MPLAPPIIKHLGRVDYEPTWAAMQAFTIARTAATLDELWVLEHPPVYTVGMAGRPQHFPRTGTIALVRTDRGGQITYHGPGQTVVYTLVDLTRRGIKVREMICLLEQAAIDYLADHGVAAVRKSGAPGVYVARSGAHAVANTPLAAVNPGGVAKIAALGLKVKRNGCYHGISLNVDLDTTPFHAIDPCGYPGLAIARTADFGVKGSVREIGEALARRISRALNEHTSKTEEAHAIPA